MTSSSTETAGTVMVRGAELAYTAAGSGPVVIVAHGLTFSRASNAATGLLELSAIVDAGFRVISYDARGHGESSGTHDPADYRWPSLADDLLAFAEAVAPGARVALVGNSMGTATSLFAALKEPERIGALVLTAPPTAWETREVQSEGYRRMADALESGDQQTLQELFENATAPDIFADTMSEAPQPDIKPELMPTVLRGAASTNLPTPEELAAIDQQTLLLPWIGDPGHPVATAEALARILPNSRLRIAHTADQVRAFGTWSAPFLEEVFSS